MINELEKEQITLNNSYLNPSYKLFVSDPAKNDLMNKLVDKYVDLVSKRSDKLEEDKFPQPIMNFQESVSVLSALRANQKKQKRLQKVKCIEEIPVDTLKPEEVTEAHKLRKNDRHSQSMIISETVVNKKKFSRHRRTESRSFDRAAIRKIMSIDLDSIDIPENKSVFKK